MTTPKGIVLNGEEGAIGRGLRWWGSTMLYLLPAFVRKLLVERQTELVFQGAEVTVNGLPLDGVKASALSVDTLPLHLSIAAEQGMFFRASLPVDGQGQVDQVALTTEVERQTPFSVDRVKVGLHQEEPIGPDGRQVFTVGIVPLTVMQDAQDELKKLGLSAAQVSYQISNDETVPLSESSGGISKARPLWAMGAACAGIFMLAVPLINGMISLNEAEVIRAAEQEKLSILAGDGNVPEASIQHLVKEILDERRATPLTTLVLEDLSKTVPDGVTLELISLEGRVLSIEGTARDSGSLLSAMERASFVSSVALTSPLVRQPDGAERFQLKISIATELGGSG